MSIRFDCVGCQKSIVVHDRFEGRNVRCPSCSFELIVPKKHQNDDSVADHANNVDAHNVDVDAEPEDGETFVDAEAVDTELTSESASASDLKAGDESDAVEPAIDLQPKAVAKKRASRSIRGGHDEPEEDVEWDITPMVDVAFLLLIFFMLTASFSIQKVIRTTPPQSDQPSKNSVQVQLDDKTEKIRVQIDEFNAYTVVFADGQTSEASSKQELITILKDFRLQAGGDQLPRIVIQAHVDSFHGATVGCMDAARAAEFTDFQLFAVESFD
jgi:biopolymer transport protein ExbD/DNA-directed RNA polymerase subunit RPC12/RpoP